MQYALFSTKIGTKIGPKIVKVYPKAPQLAAKLLQKFIFRRQLDEDELDNIVARAILEEGLDPRGESEVATQDFDLVARGKPGFDTGVSTILIDSSDA